MKYNFPFLFDTISFLNISRVNKKLFFNLVYKLIENNLFHLKYLLFSSNCFKVDTKLLFSDTEFRLFP